MNGEASDFAPLLFPGDVGLGTDGSQRDTHPILSLPLGEALWEDCRRHQRGRGGSLGFYN